MSQPEQTPITAPPRRWFTIRGLMIAIAALAGALASIRVAGLPLQLFWTLSFCLAGGAAVVCWQREGWGARGFLLLIVQIPGTILVEYFKTNRIVSLGQVGDLMFSHLLPALVFLYPALLACGGCWWLDLRRRSRRWRTGEYLVLGMLGVLTTLVGAALFMLHGFLAAGMAE